MGKTIFIKFLFNHREVPLRPASDLCQVIPSFYGIHIDKTPNMIVILQVYGCKVIQFRDTVFINQVRKDGY